jgi:hypothetical protein
MFDQIEKLKREFTDQFVKVDARLPELKRFDDFVGQVKTVNMSGRALVQFDAWNNIGWYDIDVAYLKVVPKPEASSGTSEHGAKPAAKAAPAPTSAEKKLSPLEMARAQGAAKTGATKPAAAPSAAAPAKPAPAGGKPATADILAAARSGKSTAAPAAKSESAPAAKPSGGKLSTAEILAAARAKKAAETAEAQAPAPPAAKAPSAPKPEAPKLDAAEKPAAAKPAFAAGQRPSVPEILAWCRQHDRK